MSDLGGASSVRAADEEWHITDGAITDEVIMGEEDEASWRDPSAVFLQQFIVPVLTVISRLLGELAHWPRRRAS